MRTNGREVHWLWVALTLTHFTFTGVHITNGPHAWLNALGECERALMRDYVNGLSFAVNAWMNRNNWFLIWIGGFFFFVSQLFSYDINSTQIHNFFFDIYIFGALNAFNRWQAIYLNSDCAKLPQKSRFRPFFSSVQCSILHCLSHWIPKRERKSHRMQATRVTK